MIAPTAQDAVQGGAAREQSEAQRARAAAPVAAVVLTHNEEKNLPDCLAALAGW